MSIRILEKCFLLGAALMAIPCFAQAGRAELSGVVLDPSGRAAPKAKVEAEDQATMVRYAATSDERGEYHIVGLPVGQYVLTVEHPGFSGYQQTNIRVQVAVTARIDIVLQVGQATQSVSVSAEASMLKTESAEQSTMPRAITRWIFCCHSPPAAEVEIESTTRRNRLLVESTAR